jgi:transcriptional regulator
MELNNMELTLKLRPVQRDILTALANLHRQESRAVKGKEIGEVVGRHPGTIRNQMQPLKALNLVEAVAGPKGGYKATAAAYDALSVDNSGDGDDVIVPVVRNDVVVEGASATEIIFAYVFSSPVN